MNPTTEHSLGLWPLIRFMFANLALILASAIAPKEPGYVGPLAEASRYAFNRAKGHPVEAVNDA